MQRGVEWVSKNMEYKLLIKLLSAEMIAKSVISFIDIQPLATMANYIHYTSHVFIAGMLGMQHCSSVIALAIAVHPNVGLDKFPYLVAATNVGFSTIGLLSAYTADLLIENISNVINNYIFNEQPSDLQPSELELWNISTNDDV